MSSQSLNTAQLEVLRWVDDGIPSGIYSDYSHRVTARALERRGLVAIAGRGPAWSASVTPLGRETLDGRTAPSDDTQSRVSRVIQGLIDGNGRLLLHEAWSYPQADGVKGKALQSTLRPHGKQLAYRIDKYDYKRRSGETIMWFFKDYVGDDVEIRHVPIPVKLRNLDPIAVAFRRAHGREWGIETSERATLILQAVIAEARRLGFEVHDADRLRHVSMIANGQDYGLKVKLLPVGRLELQLYGGRGSPLKAIHDAKRVQVEEKLPQLFHAIGVERLQSEQRMRAREEQDARLTAEWEVAMDNARHALREHRRAATLIDEIERCEKADRMRAYASLLKNSSRDDDEDRAGWIDWILRHADAIDPRHRAVGFPKPRPYRPEDLQPFLGGLHPEKPTARAVSWPTWNSEEDSPSL